MIDARMPKTQMMQLAARRAMWRRWLAIISRAAMLSLALLPVATVAAPIELKLSFFASAQSGTFRYGVKPFVDAVNSEGKGLIAIKVYPDGALGDTEAEQPKLLTEGTADIAWVAPGQTPYRFPDTQMLALPGLFQNVREGTLVYTHLIATNALRGYKDFFVIGAYTGAPGIIHSRKRITSLAALKGLKIRANNEVEAEAVQRLGAIPTVLSASQIANALTHGTIDAVVMGLAGPARFGAEHAAPNHYLLEIGVAPLVLVMNRKKFDSLPPAAQALIRKYSGERAAATRYESFDVTEQRVLDRIKSDPLQKIFMPSAAGRAAAQKVFQSMIEDWAARGSHNRELLARIEAEIARVRSLKESRP